MSITLRATAAAAVLVCLPMAALAQSTVTLYGRINTTVENQSYNNVSRTVVSNNSSRFGLTGSEDLGGGMKAVFRLEGGIASDTGATTGGALFGREATVGLSGGFGTVRLGQQAYLPAYLATADYVSMHNHDTGSSSDALWGGYLIDSRQGNSISYTTPDINGFKLEIAQGLNEKANIPGTVIRRKNQTDIALNYDAGPLHLGAGYEKIGDDKLYALRALYEFGALTVGGYYERDDFVVLGKRNNARITAMYTVGASEFHANYGSAGKFGNVPDSKAQQYTLGYNYNLSKRTKVYGYYTKVDNNTGLTYQAVGGQFRDFGAIAAGIRHNF
jgi:predicted porin